MARYFVDGLETSRGAAVLAWRASSTYRNARFKDAIFPNAELGVNKNGEFNHLREAGVWIEPDLESKPENRP